jgi:hypothetical protein
MDHDMQPAKDSFYVALRDRLAALAPARTIFLGGEVRPAVIVAENEPVTAAAPLPAAFYLFWLDAQAVAPASGARRPLMRLNLRIDYRTQGTSETVGVDRGRALAALDSELAQLLSPRFTPKLNHAQTPPAGLASTVLWSAPEFAPLEASDRELRRSVNLSLFFWPETDLP